MNSLLKETVKLILAEAPKDYSDLEHSLTMQQVGRVSDLTLSSQHLYRFKKLLQFQSEYYYKLNAEILQRKYGRKLRMRFSDTAEKPKSGDERTVKGSLNPFKIARRIKKYYQQDEILYKNMEHHLDDLNQFIKITNKAIEEGKVPASIRVEMIELLKTSMIEAQDYLEEADWIGGLVSLFTKTPISIGYKLLIDKLKDPTVTYKPKAPALPGEKRKPGRPRKEFAPNID
jgi:hypothetical protein